MSRNTIEMNGKLYDATTGKQLDGHHAPQTKKKPVSHHTGQVVDGFTRRPNAEATIMSVAKKVKIHTVAPAAPKKTERSHALMRHAVHKPTAAKSKDGQRAAKAHLSNPEREARATKVAKSRLISKFGIHHSSIQPQVAPLEVQPEPEIPVLTQLLQHNAQAIAGHTHGHSTHGRAHHDFEHAIHKAESHKQTRTRKAGVSHKVARKLHVSPRVVRAVSGFATALLIVGFIVYQNTPNLAMHVAAARAGISARLPGYKPSGFSMKGAIQYSPGQIMVSYKSNSDERNFKLTQQSTDLTNETLLSQQVAVTKKPYQTYQDKGKTIYVYDDSNATWVDKGILYQVEGESALNTDQLLRLAGSL